MEEQADTTSLWDGIREGGPVIMAIHLLMVVGFCLAIVLSFRRAGSLLAFACSIAPFAFGALAMWFGILGFTAIFPSFSSGVYDGNPVSLLHLLQRPFIFGSGLSFVALVIYFTTRARYPNTCNAEPSARGDAG